MSTADSSLVLVTGVSGYLGAHIVHQLLQAGYRVRGTARSAKVSSVQKQYAGYGERVEIVGLDDLTHGDYTLFLEDVSAVIHNAAPLPGRETSPITQIDAGVEGTRNILSYVEHAHVKNFVLVSSIITVSESASNDPFTLITDKDWNAITREIALDSSSSAFAVYAAEKKFAEQAAWEWAASHPNVEVATVNPTFFIGPFAGEWAPSKMDISAISTNWVVYNLLFPAGPVTNTPPTIDVRDVARACVLSLTAPPTSAVGRKRFILCAEWFSSSEAVEHIENIHPELKNRLSKSARHYGPGPESNLDTSRAKEILGLEFTDWRKTLGDAVNSLLELEQEWLGKGWQPQTFDIAELE